MAIQPVENQIKIHFQNYNHKKSTILRVLDVPRFFKLATSNKNVRQTQQSLIKF